jgi:hypothetical protein
MRKLLASAAIAATVLLGGPIAAYADGDHGNHGGGHSAPEPITIVGLALGAAGIGAARWAWGRRSGRRR